MPYKPQIEGIDYYETGSAGGMTFTQPTSSPVSMAQYDSVVVTHPAITDEKALYTVMVQVLGHDLIPTMTSNTAPSGTASASSIYDAAHDAYFAFNNLDDAAGWATISGTLTGWLAYEFASYQYVNSYRLRCQNHINGPTAAPKNWTFEGWNGSSWDTLDTQTNITGWSTGVWEEFVLASREYYKKFRINITANNGQATYTGIGEMEIEDESHYESAILGRQDDSADFVISRISSTVTSLKRMMAGTSNVYFSIVTP